MRHSHNGKRPNGATIDSSTGTNCYCEYGQTGRNGAASWKNCPITGTLPPAGVQWKGCEWKQGDGSGGSETYIGKVSNPSECAEKCTNHSKNGKKPNGVTVDSSTGTSCYCEYGQSGRNGNAAWKNCQVNGTSPSGGIQWQGCDWKQGDGSGGSETNIGTVSNPADCVEKCKKHSHNGKRANGATVDSSTGTNCYCEYGQTGRNAAASWKNCPIASTLPPVGVQWKGCEWKQGDGSGGTETNIGTVGSPVECVEKCTNHSKNGEKPNGVTVDSSTGTNCYCEYGQTGRNGAASWKNCKFPIQWNGCEWKTGDGSGGSETNIGKVSNPAECVAKCKQHSQNGKKPNGVTVDSSTGTNCYCEYGQTGRNGAASWKNCPIASKLPPVGVQWKGCEWKQGDGSGGTETNIGTVGSPAECVEKCTNHSKNGEKPNGVTVDSSTGTNCYCEYGQTGRNGAASWKNCKFPIQWDGCEWKTGDGSGGSETNIGRVSNPAECVAKCKQHSQSGKKPNGVTVDSSTGTNCYCEYGQTGRNGATSWKNCGIQGTSPPGPIQWTGCQWQQGDGSGGTETNIGTVSNPAECVEKCTNHSKNGKKPNGVTVDSSTGTNCYCEYGQTGRNGAASWKNCRLPIQWDGCEWRTGDGSGGSETNIGKVNNPAQCVAKCKQYSQNGKRPNGVTVDSSTGTNCYCEYGQTGRNAAASWKNCPIASTLPPVGVQWKGCEWKQGDGSGGTETNIGTVGSPVECVEKCTNHSKNGKKPNGVTVDSSTGTNCYCEYGQTGRNGAASWKNCKFPIQWDGCEWKTGDGSGGSETNIGKVSNPAECVAKCKQHSQSGKKPNGVTVDSSTGTNCYCEYGQTGRNGAASWKNCPIASKLPPVGVQWKGCEWKQGDGSGGTETNIGTVSNPAECVEKCTNHIKNGKKPNGVTVDSSTGTNCYCEYGQTGRNGAASWKNCKFPIQWDGCKWKTGDGSGGSETNIGRVSNPAECVAKCKQHSQSGKKPNGVTVDSSTGTNCYCEYGQTGRNGATSWKNCGIQGTSPPGLIQWTGCQWQQGDGSGGSETNIGKVGGPAECVQKCKKHSQNGRKPNGVTIDSSTGTNCYCEYGQSGRNGSSSWKNCPIAI